jgi:hypothetical protein
MKQLKMYKLVSKNGEDELAEINECRLPSRIIPDWQEKYGDFNIIITLIDGKLNAALQIETVGERKIAVDDVAQICADAVQLIEESELPEALPTYADRLTNLLGAPIKLETLVYLSESPENVRNFLTNQS